MGCLRLACLLLAATFSIAFAQTNTGNDSPTTIIEIKSAEFFQRGDSDAKSLALPPADAKWARTELPDSWQKQKRPKSRLGWYRFSFDASTTQIANRQALYIPRITNNVEIYLNGTSFAVSGRLGPEPEYVWNFAQYFPLPSGLLKAGRNEIMIRLHPDGLFRAGLSQISIGDAEQIKVRYEERYLIQTSAPKFITVMLCLVALFSLSLWWKRRKESMFGFFGLMLVVAIIRIIHYYLRDVPLYLAYLAVPSVCWLTVLQVQFALRFAGESLPRFEKVLIAIATISTIALFVVPMSWYGRTTIVIYAVFSVLAFVILGVVGRLLLRKVTVENVLMLTAIVLNVIFGIHDFLNFQELLGFDRIYLMPLGLPMMLMAVAALLIKRFVETLGGYEHLNAELVARVAERERELSLSYERLRTLDQQRTTAEERQRLMRDMHDGVGSHLMSTLALARMGTLSQTAMQDALSDCIDELKITIDSLEPVESDLLVVLGNLRYRLEPRLNAAGIKLDWAISDLPPLGYLDPENTRSILRIVQEAFTNTLKHAGARNITLSTSVDYANARVIVRVTDDGQGFSPGQSNGRGLENMKSRAAKLNGDVELVSLKGGGTCVNLYLPLAKIV